MPAPQIATVLQHIAWSYANLARAHAAIESGATSYGRIHHIIRSKLFKGLGLATRHSSCRLHWLSSWPCATDLCDFSRVGRLGVARRPTQLALGDVRVRDANVSNSNSVCDAVSTVPSLRTVSTAMPIQSSPSSRVRIAAIRQACDPLKFHGFCRLSRGCDA